MDWEVVYQFIIESIGFLYEKFSLFYVILMVVTMGIIIGLCALIKKPIKALTKRIANEKLRKLANKTIIILAYGISIGLYYLLGWLLPQYITVDWVQITLSASLAIVAYALGDGIITKNTAKLAVDDLKEIVKDGKVDENDESAIKEFYNKVK